MKLRISAALLAATLALGGLPSAAAADGGDTTRAEEAFKTVVGQTSGLAALLNGTAADATVLTIDESGKADKVLSMGSDGSDALSLPADAAEPILMTREGGTSVGVALPGTPDRGKPVGGNMVLFEDIAKDTDALVQAQTDAGVRVLTVIKSAQAPTEFDYNLKLDDGHKLRSLQDGRVVIVDGDDIVLSIIEAPWAYDAQGNAVAVKYTTSDDVLTLNVLHDDSTVYPVLADPVFKWGIISGTLYLDRQETRNIAVTGIVPAAVFALAGPFGWYLALSVAEMVAWAWTANASDGTCLKLKFGWQWNWGRLNRFFEPGHYQDEAGVRCS